MNFASNSTYNFKTPVNTVSVLRYFKTLSLLYTLYYCAFLFMLTTVGFIDEVLYKSMLMMEICNSTPAKMLSDHITVFVFGGHFNKAKIDLNRSI